MYKLIATDANGNELEKRFLMSKPNELDIEKFFYEVVKKYETFIFIKNEQVSYIEMGAVWKNQLKLDQSDQYGQNWEKKR